MNLLGNYERNKISLLTDPFQKEKITSMMFWFGYNEWHGLVKFTNGNTSGEYKTKYYKEDEFHLCVKEADELIKSLKSI